MRAGSAIALFWVILSVVTLPADFLVISKPSAIPGDNSAKLSITHDGQKTELEFPGPNGKLESDIAYRKLWSGDISL